MARTSLERLCVKSDRLQVMRSFENAEEAQQYLIEHPADLILLDIELPGMSGIDFLEKIPVLPQILFTTSHEDYAFQAFEYDVTDYLKKPISIERFDRAIEKCIKVAERKQEQVDLSRAKEIYVKVDRKLVRVPFDEVLYFENAGDYISVVTTTDKYLIYGTIKSLDQRLAYPRFIKVHRSYIINLDYVKDIEDSSLIISDKVIPISRAHKAGLLSTINLL